MPSLKNGKLPKCSCPWVEQSGIALRWIILCLAVICQSQSHNYSRCTFWVTAISVHLGSYLLVTGRFGAGGWWRKGNWGPFSSPFCLQWLSPTRTTRTFIPMWISLSVLEILLELGCFGVGIILLNKEKSVWLLSQFKFYLFLKEKHLRKFIFVLWVAFSPVKVSLRDFSLWNQ